MDFKGKKLLILAGQGVHCKVVEAAKEMGVYTIVADNLENSPAKLIADEKVMISILDVDSLIDFCKREKVDGVMNYCNDLASKVQYRIGEALGLPCIGNAEQVLKLTDKKVFKQLCMENGLDTIESFSENEVLSGFVKFPILVKPTDSRGSRGISVCKNLDDFKQAVSTAQKESLTGQFLIERYMVGKQDFTVSYLVTNGEPYIVRTGDRYFGNKEDGLQNQCNFCVSPSHYTEFFLQKLDSKFRRLIKTIGIQNGPVFVQGFIDDGTIRFYDPGIRFPGSEYDRVLAKATGVNLIKKMIAFALENKISEDFGELQDSYKLCNKCSLQIMVDSRPGVIGKISGIETIKNLPEVVHIEQKAKVGDKIPCSGDVRQRIFEIILMTDNSHEKICEAVNKVKSLLVVEDEKGNNMLVSFFDTKKLIY